MPASENMKVAITMAIHGERLASPDRSEISSLSKPLRDSTMIRPNVPSVVSSSSLPSTPV